MRMTGWLWNVGVTTRKILECLPMSDEKDYVAVGDRALEDVPSVHSCCTNNVDSCIVTRAILAHVSVDPTPGATPPPPARGRCEWRAG